jgi:IrrE N-terminal-like domain
MSGYLIQNKVWVDLESKRNKRLLREVWNSLPADIRRPLEDRVVKICDDQRHFEHVNPDFIAQCEFRYWGCEIFFAAIMKHLNENVVRFTIAHELGHAFLHFSKDLRDKTSRRKLEHEANAFAKELGYSRRHRKGTKKPVRQRRAIPAPSARPQKNSGRANDTPTK